MRARIYRNNALTLEKGYQEPSPYPGEALIRVICAGICNTDLGNLMDIIGISNGLPYGAARHLTPSQAAPKMSAKVSAKRLHTDQPDWTILDNSNRSNRSTGRNMHYQEAPKRQLAEFDSPCSDIWKSAS